jgi:predicted RNase H-like HicB family nuclease
MVESGENNMKIYGYLFQIASEKGEWGYVAYAPGVGGVYEEGATEKQAISNAYEAACAILETRLERNDPITEDNNPYLKVLTTLPNLQHIISIKEIPDAYIATPRRLVPAGAY